MMIANTGLRLVVESFTVNITPQLAQKPDVKACLNIYTMIMMMMSSSGGNNDDGGGGNSGGGSKDGGSVVAIVSLY
ncbi:hypothetical protein HZH66_003511 [Vespula vulgaris]|uniref:Uncharacterized protein n=1 Tax=Vespula vulgaris TaxID=7454 RepID=A0A834KDK7_VESVU|nr:hypothetical protein HZH66_003511 [Vespula vulgaris]